MKPDLRWLLLLALGACLNKATFVSITPDHGYADGCIDVVLQGHHLGTTAKGSVGGTDFLEIAAAEEDKDLPEQAQDVGFKYYALVPPGTKGWADVTMTIDGEKQVLEDGFYYEACPASLVVDSVTVPNPAAVGASIDVVGCGLTDSVSIDVYEDTGTTVTGTGAPLPVANIPLILDCGTARAHAEVPNLPAGAYVLAVTHDDGTTYTGECFFDSGDTAATCSAISLVIGGAR